MAKPWLTATSVAQLHIWYAGQSSRLRRTRIRESRAFPDAARPRHADGIACRAALIRRTIESSSAQRLQIQRPVIKRLRARARRRDASLRPAPMAGVENELVFDVLARQRLMGAAAHMGVAFLDDAAVPHYS